jgi:terminase small subunit-like protein
MMWAYRTDSEELRGKWNDALRDSADSLFDEALQTARDSKLDSRHARVKCAVLQWAAEKRDPDRYAPRSKHDLTVKTLDLSPILARAEARLAASRIIEGEVLRPMLAVRTAADLM